MSTQAIALDTAARHRFVLTILFAGFVLTGIEITLAGPLLPLFIARWSLTDAQAGIFSTVQFACSLGGVWLSSLIAHYWGPRAPVVLGYFAMGVGLATANSASMNLALVALALLGTGYGLVVPPTNLMVAQIGGARSASLVSLVNFAWGAGAVSCSPLVVVALKNSMLSQLLYALAAFGILIAICALFAVFPASSHTTDVSNTSESPFKISAVSIVVLAALFLLYVGVETSIGIWAATRADRLPGGRIGLSTLAPMFFYGGLMTGRAAAPVFLARVREYRLVIIEVLVVIAGTAFFILADNQKTAFLSAALAGLGCSAIFPIYVTWLSRWFGAKANRVAGLMFSMSSVGSTSGPWLVGFVSAHAGGIGVGLLVPLLSAALMLILLILVRRQATA